MIVANKIAVLVTTIMGIVCMITGDMQWAILFFVLAVTGRLEVMRLEQER